jgi:hypothetical protein
VNTFSPDRIRAFAKFWLVEAIPSPEPPEIRQMSSSSVILWILAR